ncbi:MAG: cryptochrome/photolyase family protein [Bacteroidota bacterium]
MPINRIVLLLGDQLFPDHSSLRLDAETLVFMAEDYGLCTHFRYHKHKLILFLAAMREHAQQLQGKEPNHPKQPVSVPFQMRYLRLRAGVEESIWKAQDSSIKKEGFPTYFYRLSQVLTDFPEVKEITTYEVEDHFFADQLQQFCAEKGLQLHLCPNPGFMTSREQFSDYLQRVKKPFMHTFYQQQRRRLNLLLDDEAGPLHGKWSFDEDNRKKLPKGIELPSFPVISPTPITQEVMEMVDKIFPDHPGSVDNFWLATTRKQALELLNKFLQERFQQFGPYEDAFEADQVFLFHTVLSPYINCGLITAGEVVERVIAYAERNDIHYPSLEGLVRQLIGWREFIRGMYHNYEGEMRRNNFDHQGKLTEAWYDGTTGIAPLDDAIKKAQAYGYTHHIERLMVIGNMMLLSEIHPEEVNRWFMEMYVDSADWVMVPNVFGMSQFAGGGVFATKPYICGANYWSKMSRYSKKSDWADVVDGLYWRFIDRKRELFLSNPRMSMMVRLLDKMAPEKQQRIFSAAQSWVAKYTC